MPQLKQSSQSRGFSMRAEAGRAEIFLYDVIDPWYGISAKQFQQDLKALGEVAEIDLRINSPGGNIFEGTAIHSILKRHPAKVTAHVDGVAASMASVVAMAADEIVMAAGSYMMIHNPLGGVYGEADDLREYADLLDKAKSQIVGLYAARTKRADDEIERLMDDETWFTPDEAVAAGFADRTSAEIAMAASIAVSHFKNVPPNLRGEARMSQDPNANANTPTPPQPAGYADLKAALPGADAAFICSQMEANATAAQAQTAWMAEQNRRLEAANKQAEDAKKKADEAEAKAAAKKSGVEPLGSGSAGKEPPEGGDPVARFNELVAAKIAAGKKKAKAVSDVIDENPALHEEYLAACNAGKK